LPDVSQFLTASWRQYMDPTMPMKRTAAIDNASFILIRMMGESLFSKTVLRSRK